MLSRSYPLRVLMYHQVSSDGTADPLTVPVPAFTQQLQYLQQEGYTSILLSELVSHIRIGTALPHKPVLISFDDGYRDNYTNAYPVLERLGMKANIFLVPTFLNKGQYLSIEDIRTMDPALVEYGLHSYDHQSYAALSVDAMRNDLVQCAVSLELQGVPYQPCVAFPYGAYPKKGVVNQRFFEALSDERIAVAFRIGNRLNPFPLRNPLLIQRLDVRGNNNFSQFTRLVRKGKSWF